MTRNIKRKNIEEKYPRLQISEFPIFSPSYFEKYSSKDEAIKNWLKEHISNELRLGKIADNTLLPLKSKLAYFFGVGEGTAQNAVRKLEDEGIVISRQRIGTLIITKNSDTTENMTKLTSKRDKVVEQIKILIKKDYNIGDTLPNMKELEQILNAKRNTIRNAIEYLTFQKYITPTIDANEDNKTWQIIKEVDENEIKNLTTSDVATETLAQKISLEIEKDITKNCKIGSRIKPINILAKKYNVSEKTAYDAIQILFEKNILQSRRGKYGTIVTKMPNDAFQPTKERSIFMPAAEAAIYSYRRIENILRNKIAQEYKVGERLPSMKELAQELDVSTNTIRKAIMDLTADGYLAVSRGKFGGIYILDIPQETTQSFRWLAVNPQYVKSYS